MRACIVRGGKRARGVFSFKKLEGIEKEWNLSGLTSCECDETIPRKRTDGDFLKNAESLSLSHSLSLQWAKGGWVIFFKNSGLFF